VHVMDVKMTSLLQKAYLPKASLETGYSAHKAEKFKESWYRDTIGTHNGEIFGAVLR